MHWWHLSTSALQHELETITLSKFLKIDIENLDDVLVDVLDDFLDEEVGSTEEDTTEEVVDDDGNELKRTFKSQKLLEEHYEKHGQEIANVLGKTEYTIAQYLEDANYIITNGTYTLELHGYVSFMSGKKYGFVGLDRITGDITTFHIKDISELSKKAPSLGLER